VKGTGKAKDATEDLVETTKFMMLGLELPPAPLYKDSMETNILPQVQLYLVLQKFDNQLEVDSVKLGRRRFLLTKLPRYMVTAPSQQPNPEAYRLNFSIYQSGVDVKCSYSNRSLKPSTRLIGLRQGSSRNPR
jgi:hypothetical protein